MRELGVRGLNRDRDEYEPQDRLLVVRRKRRLLEREKRLPKVPSELEVLQLGGKPTTGP